MQSSVKLSFALNLTYTLSGLLFNLITFPYVSRILLAQGVGIIYFYQSIISYVTLCSALGIPLYAVREIARVRDNIALRNKITIEILLLHILLTFGGYVIIFVLAATVTKIQVNIPLFLLLSSNLFFTAIGTVWFYQGIEDFRYITIRALSIRVLSLISLFLFVHEESDLLRYALILVTAEVGNNIINFIRLRKFICLREFKVRELHPFRHLIPALKIFVLNLVISIYVHLDSVMLGFLKDEVAVGYYAASTRITKSILGIVQSLGGVLLPRLSNLAGDRRMDEFKNLSNKAVGFILAVSLPLTVGVIFMASPLIHLFCGDNFEPSILTIQIIAPIILFISVSNISGPQILYSLGKENLVVLATIGGAAINVSLNFLLIPSYSQYGAGIATSIAEFVVMILMIVFVWKYIPVRIFSKETMNYYIATFLMGISLFILSLARLNEYVFCGIGIVLSTIIYIVFLIWRKDYIVIALKKFLINRE